MTTYPVIDPVSGWSLAPDGPPPGAFYEQAVLTLTLLDEITGLPPAVPIQATTATIGLTARASTGGLAGPAGPAGPDGPVPFAAPDGRSSAQPRAASISRS